MIAVVLRYENGATEEVLLAGVPRVGDDVRLPNGNAPTLIVEGVLWQASRGGTQMEPTVYVSVRQRPK